MNSLDKEGGEPSREKMPAFINQQIPNFESQLKDYRIQIYAQVKEY